MPDDPTLGELYRLLQGIESRLDRVLDDHETRLRKLERWQYAMPPTFLLAAASVVAAIFK